MASLVAYQTSSTYPPKELDGRHHCVRVEMTRTPLSPVSLQLLFYKIEVAPTALSASNFKLFSLLPTLFQQVMSPGVCPLPPNH